MPIIRYPTMQDVDQLMSFINSLVREKAYLGTQRLITRKKEALWLRGMLARVAKRQMVYLVMEEKGKIVGGAEVARGQLEADRHVGFLGIGLKKEARGCGLGYRLMTEVVAEAKQVLKIKMLRVSAMANNDRALKMYRKFGCRLIGQVKKGYLHYGRYVDNILMVKYL